MRNLRNTLFSPLYTKTFIFSLKTAKSAVETELETSRQQFVALEKRLTSSNESNDKVSNGGFLVEKKCVF